MIGYNFSLGCPTCGGPLEHLAGGKSDRREVQAVAWCYPCRRRVLVRVQVIEVDSCIREGSG